MTRCLLMMMVVMLLHTSVQNSQAEEKSTAVKFKRVQLDPKFRSEGVAVGDFNRDGKMDIAAGRVYYIAPDWKMYSLVKEAKEFKPKGYSGSFVNAAADLNNDGWTDIMIVDFPGTPTYWYENPKKLGAIWKRHLLTPVSNNESPQFANLLGNGKKQWLMAVAPSTSKSDGPDRFMAYLTPQSDPTKPWNIHRISKNAAANTTKYSHGLGIGDLNGDGRKDVIVPQGWWEAPKKNDQKTWKFHAAKFGPAAAQMYIFDFDGDGDADVLSSSAHNYGIWWHEQLKDGAWKTHEIDKQFSQTHGMCLADINGDGLPDFVTGKRWYAHGGGDPGGKDPAVFYWYQLSRKNGKASWTAHHFDHNSGPGTQFEIADVNRDGLPDVVSSNKKGVYYFQQVKPKKQ